MALYIVEVIAGICSLQKTARSTKWETPFRIAMIRMHDSPYCSLVQIGMPLITVTLSHRILFSCDNKRPYSSTFAFVRCDNAEWAVYWNTYVSLLNDI